MLYLILVVVFISYTIFGELVLREHNGGRYIPFISQLSKGAYFLSTIGTNIKKMFSDSFKRPSLVKEDRFIKSQSGFIGKPDRNGSYLLLSRFNGDLGESVIELVDLKNFSTIHTWNPDLDYIIKEHIPKIPKWKNLSIDRNDSRARLFHPKMLDDGSLIFNFSNSPLIKIGKNSELIFALSDEEYHHSVESDLDGNIWACVSYFPFKISEKYVGDKINNYMDDGIRKISPDGEVLFDKSISQIFIENGLKYLLFAIHGHELEKDPIHINDIEPVKFDGKYWKEGDVFLSLGHQSMIMLYRPSTNKIIWKRTGDFYHQHDIDIISESKISFFDNNSIYTYKEPIVENSNKILIYDFDTDDFTSYLHQSLVANDVRTISQGLHKITSDGDLFIEETNYGRLLFFSPNGDLIWSYFNRSNRGELFSLNWSRLLFKQKDIQKVRSFLKIKIEVAQSE